MGCNAYLTPCKDVGAPHPCGLSGEPSSSWLSGSEWEWASVARISHEHYRRYKTVLNLNKYSILLYLDCACVFLLCSMRGCGWVAKSRLSKCNCPSKIMKNNYVKIQPILNSFNFPQVYYVRDVCPIIRSLLAKTLCGMWREVKAPPTWTWPW